MLKGEIIYFHAFDVAYELRLADLNLLLGNPLVTHQIGLSKRSPRQQLFYLPKVAKLDPIPLATSIGEVLVQRTVKVLPIGAVSITLRIAFAVNCLEDLSAFQRLAFTDAAIQQHVKFLAEQLRIELAPFAVRPVSAVLEGEAYTVFCIETPREAGEGCLFNSEKWFDENRNTIAALVTQEPDGALLSDQEALESTSKHLSYYKTDLIVADWDAALVVDRPVHFAEALYVMELANLQLEELIAYDRLVDMALERSYSDLLQPSRARNRKGLLPHLREVRIDLARFGDELSNITKFFGDWHLARLYDTVSNRFHLADWHRTIDKKLKTLDDLYEMLKQEENHRIMFILEASVVVMFLIDIILLIAELVK